MSLRLSVLPVVTAVVLSLGAAVPAQAAEDPAAVPELSPALADVPVESVRFEQLERDFQAARSQRVQAEARIVELRAAEVQLQERARRAERDRQAAERELARIEATITELAVQSYVAGGETSGALIDPVEATEQHRQVVVLGTVQAEQLAARHLAEATLVAARATLEAARDELVQTRAALEENEVLARAGRETESELAPRRALARATATVAGHDFTLVALDAYWSAAAALRYTHPECGLHWSLVAGIARVEGNHGTFGGRTLDGWGQTSPPILGIPLDGTRNTRAIGDTDGGRLDGDTTWDRAVGPMQFIPSTWARYAQDGNGDGVADPHNLYDAALAAAEYLCRSGPGLDAAAGANRAVFSYNHSQAYVSRVTGLADGYRQLPL